jgi:transposase
MDVLHPRCAGLDISKKDAKACLRLPGKRAGTYTREVTTWGSTTNQILALRDFLIDANVTLVAIEATGDYWKPFYYLLEDVLTVILVNPRHVKGVPGRKTDVNDAQWLAQLAAHGLVRACFVPPEPIRRLRDMTRARTAATRDRTRVTQRLEKLLEDAGIKLSAVASRLTGVSSRQMLQALIAGQSSPEQIANLARTRMRGKIPQLVEALTGRFTDHHAFLTRLYLSQIDQLTQMIDELTARIEVMIEPFRAARDLLVTIPGVDAMNADVIIAETGADMSVFPTAGHLASWAGLTPGHHQSADTVKSAKTRPGDRYLKAALGAAALVITRTRGTYLSALYKRLASRRGPAKATVAVQHSILTSTWHMLTQQQPYHELGGDHFTKLDPARVARRAISQLNQLGFAVTLNPIQTATQHQHQQDHSANLRDH